MNQMRGRAVPYPGETAVRGVDMVNQAPAPTQRPQGPPPSIPRPTRAPDNFSRDIDYTQIGGAAYDGMREAQAQREQREYREDQAVASQQENQRRQAAMAQRQAEAQQEEVRKQHAGRYNLEFRQMAESMGRKTIEDPTTGRLTFLDSEEDYQARRALERQERVKQGLEAKQAEEKALAEEEKKARMRPVGFALYESQKNLDALTLKAKADPEYRSGLEEDALDRMARAKRQEAISGAEGRLDEILNQQLPKKGWLGDENAQARAELRTKMLEGELDPETEAELQKVNPEAWAAAKTAAEDLDLWRQSAAKKREAEDAKAQLEFGSAPEEVANLKARRDGNEFSARKQKVEAMAAQAQAEYGRRISWLDSAMSQMRQRGGTDAQLAEAERNYEIQRMAAERKLAEAWRGVEDEEDLLAIDLEDFNQRLARAEKAQEYARMVPGGNLAPEDTLGESQPPGEGGKPAAEKPQAGNVGEEPQLAAAPPVSEKDPETDALITQWRDESATKAREIQESFTTRPLESGQTIEDLARMEQEELGKLNATFPAEKVGEIMNRQMQAIYEAEAKGEKPGYDQLQRVLNAAGIKADARQFYRKTVADNDAKVNEEEKAKLAEIAATHPVAKEAMDIMAKLTRKEDEIQNVFNPEAWNPMAGEDLIKQLGDLSYKITSDEEYFSVLAAVGQAVPKTDVKDSALSEWFKGMGRQFRKLVTNSKNLVTGSQLEWLQEHADDKLYTWRKEPLDEANWYTILADLSLDSKNQRELTEEEKTKVLDFVTREKRRQFFVQDLMNTWEGKAASLEKTHKTEGYEKNYNTVAGMVSVAAESMPYMLSFTVPGGGVLALGSFAEDERRRLEGTDLTANEKLAVALPVAAVQTGIEKLQQVLMFKGAKSLPGIAKMGALTGNLRNSLVGRFAATKLGRAGTLAGLGGAALGIEYAEEWLQQLTPHFGRLTYQAIAEAQGLTKLPSELVDWDKFAETDMEPFYAMTPEILGGMLLMTGFTSIGAANAQHRQYVLDQMRNKTMMRAIGVPEADIAELMRLSVSQKEGEGPAAALKAFKAVKRDPYSPEAEAARQEINQARKIAMQQIADPGRRDFYTGQVLDHGAEAAQAMEGYRQTWGGDAATVAANLNRQAKEADLTAPDVVTPEDLQLAFDYAGSPQTALPAQKAADNLNNLSVTESLDDDATRQGRQAVVAQTYRDLGPQLAEHYRAVIPIAKTIRDGELAHDEAVRNAQATGDKALLEKAVLERQQFRQGAAALRTAMRGGVATTEDEAVLKSKFEFSKGDKLAAPVARQTSSGEWVISKPVQDYLQATYKDAADKFLEMSPEEAETHFQQRAEKRGSAETLRQQAQEARQQAEAEAQVEDEAAPKAKPAKKKAKGNPKDIESMTQEEYADWLTENRMELSESDVYHELTAKPAYRGKVSGARIESNPAFEAEIEAAKAAIKDDGFKSGETNTWLVAGVNEGLPKAKSGSEKKARVTEKGYVTFKDFVKDFKAREFRALLQGLRARGFNGTVKFPTDVARAQVHFDNLVIHGKTKADVELGLAVAQEIFGGKIATTQMGQDKGTASHTSDLAGRVIKARRAAQAQAAPQEQPPNDYTAQLLNQRQDYAARAEASVNQMVPAKARAKAMSNVKTLMDQLAVWGDIFSDVEFDAESPVELLVLPMPGKVIINPVLAADVFVNPKVAYSMAAEEVIHIAMVRAARATWGENWKTELEKLWAALPAELKNKVIRKAYQSQGGTIDATEGQDDTLLGAKSQQSMDEATGMDYRLINEFGRMLMQKELGIELTESVLAAEGTSKDLKAALAKFLQKLADILESWLTGENAAKISPEARATLEEWLQATREHPLYQEVKAIHQAHQAAMAGQDVNAKPGKAAPESPRAGPAAAETPETLAAKAASTKLTDQTAKQLRAEAETLLNQLEPNMPAAEKKRVLDQVTKLALYMQKAWPRLKAETGWGGYSWVSIGEIRQNKFGFPFTLKNVQGGVLRLNLKAMLSHAQGLEPQYWAAAIHYLRLQEIHGQLKDLSTVRNAQMALEMAPMEMLPDVVAMINAARSGSRTRAVETHWREISIRYINENVAAKMKTAQLIDATLDHIRKTRGAMPQGKDESLASSQLPLARPATVNVTELATVPQEAATQLTQWTRGGTLAATVQQMILNRINGLDANSSPILDGNGRPMIWSAPNVIALANAWVSNQVRFRSRADALNAIRVKLAGHQSLRREGMEDLMRATALLLSRFTNDRVSRTDLRTWFGANEEEGRRGFLGRWTRVMMVPQMQEKANMLRFILGLTSDATPEQIYDALRETWHRMRAGLSVPWKVREWAAEHNWQMDANGVPIIPEVLEPGDALFGSTLTKETAIVPPDHPLVTSGWLEAGEVTRLEFRQAAALYLSAQMSRPEAGKNPRAEFIVAAPFSNSKGWAAKHFGGDGGLTMMDALYLIPEQQGLNDAGEGRAYGWLQDEAWLILNEATALARREGRNIRVHVQPAEYEALDAFLSRLTGYQAEVILLTSNPATNVRLALAAATQGMWMSVYQLLPQHQADHIAMFYFVGKASSWPVVTMGAVENAETTQVEVDANTSSVVELADGERNLTEDFKHRRRHEAALPTVLGSGEEVTTLEDAARALGLERRPRGPSSGPNVPGVEITQIEHVRHPGREAVSQLPREWDTVPARWDPQQIVQALRLALIVRQWVDSLVRVGSFTTLQAAQLEAEAYGRIWQFLARMMTAPYLPGASEAIPNLPSNADARLLGMAYGPLNRNQTLAIANRFLNMMRQRLGELGNQQLDRLSDVEGMIRWWNQLEAQARTGQLPPLGEFSPIQMAQIVARFAKFRGDQALLAAVTANPLEAEALLASPEGLQAAFGFLGLPMPARGVGEPFTLPERPQLPGEVNEDDDRLASSQMPDPKRQQALNRFLETKVDLPYEESDVERTPESGDPARVARELADAASQSDGSDSHAALALWARQNNRLLWGDEFVALVRKTGGTAQGAEHVVYFFGDRVVKVTKANRFQTISPVTYLEELGNSNEAFWGGSIRVEGVVDIGAGPQIVTSVPFIKGRAATDKEKAAYFRTQGYYATSPGVAPAYYNPDTKMEVRDARDVNVLTDENGIVWPVDVHVQQVPEFLEASFANSVRSTLRQEAWDDAAERQTLSGVIKRLFGGKKDDDRLASSQLPSNEMDGQITPKMSPMTRLRLMVKTVDELAAKLGRDKAEIREIAKTVAKTWKPEHGPISQALANEVMWQLGKEGVDSKISMANKPSASGDSDALAAPTMRGDESDGAGGAGNVSDYEAEIADFLAEMDRMVFAEDPKEEMWRREVEAAAAEGRAPNPKYANPVKSKTGRAAFDVAAQGARDANQAEDFDYWDEEGRRFVRERGGAQQAARAIVAMTLRGEALSPGQTRGAMQIANQIWQEALASGDPIKMREAREFTWAYANSRTTSARALAAGRDFYATPEERNLAYVTSRLSKLSKQAETKVENAGKPGSEYTSKAEALEAEQAAQWARFSEELRMNGLSLMDIFQGKNVAKLRSHAKIKTLINQVGKTAKEREALRMMLDGHSNRQIAKKTGLEAKSVLVPLEDRFQKEAFTLFREWARLGYSLDSLPDEALGSAAVAAVNPEIRLEMVARQMTEALIAQRAARNAGRVRVIDTTTPNASRFNLAEQMEVYRLGHLLQIMSGDGYDVLNELWRNSVLSGLVTHGVNIAGTWVNAALEYGIQRPLEALANEALLLINQGDPGGPRLMEFVHIMRAIVPALQEETRYAQAAWQSETGFWDAAKLDQPATLEEVAEQGVGRVHVSETVFLQMLGRNAWPRYQQVRQRTLRRLLDEGVPRAEAEYRAQQAAHTAIQNTDAYRLQNWADERGVSRVVRGRVARIPQRALLWADQLNKGVLGRMEVAAHAYRIAKRERLSGQAMENRMRELLQPGSEAWVAAVAATQRMTFTGNLRTLAEGGSIFEHGARALGGLRTARVNHPALRFLQFIYGMVFPFINTPFLIADRAYKWTPVTYAAMAIEKVFQTLGGGITGAQEGLEEGVLGMFRGAVVGSFRGAIAVNPAYSERLTQATNMAIAGGITYLLFAGTEGDDDDDEKWFYISGSHASQAESRGERELHARSEGSPMTIRIFGHNIYYGRMDPLAMTLATQVDTIRAIKKGMRAKFNLMDYYDAIAGYWLTQMNDKSYMQGAGKLAALFDSFTPGAYPGEKQRALKDLFWSPATAIVPNLVKQPMRNMDDYMREYKERTWLYDLFPVGNLAQPKLDLYGNPVKRQFSDSPARVLRALMATGLEPSANPNEPFDDFMKAFMADFAEMPEGLTLPATAKVFKYRDAKGQEVKMTDEEIYRYKLESGRRFRDRSRLRLSYADLAHPSEEKMREMVNLLGETRAQVRREMFPSQRRWESLSRESRERLQAASR